jgi:hypothetical protein
MPDPTLKDVLDAVTQVQGDLAQVRRDLTKGPRFAFMSARAKSASSPKAKRTRLESPAIRGGPQAPTRASQTAFVIADRER